MTLTFVSSLIDLEENRPVDKSTQRYFDLFNQLQSTGIRIHLFLSPNYRGRVTLTNGVVEYISLKDLDMYNIAPPGVPEYRNALHDTRNFLILMNAKIELMQRAINSKMHTSSHYAWIDFGICHMFKTPETSLRQLTELSTTSLPDSCMFVPGCWDKTVVMTHVNWRFCGSFFVGDIESIHSFYKLYIEEYPKLASLTWEVNVWAYLESIGWSPTWYKADHDDSILSVPYTTGIVRVPSKVPLYWAGGYSGCHPASAMERYVFDSICKRDIPVSAVFTQSDGLIGDEEYSRMSASLGREDRANTPAGREFSNLEASAREGTKPIVCMLCTRQFSRPNLLLLPLDDDTFNRGLTAVLSNIPSPRWENRKSVAFWRGGASGCDRPTVRMRLSDAVKDLPYVDVKFTPGSWPENDATIPPDQFVSERSDLAKHFEYKYIFIIDGNCIASAHQWVFGSGAVPIMVTHPDNEYWFKKYLKPMVNYVPINYDLSDLAEKLQWLVTHDEDARKIAENALLFSKSVFSTEFQQAYVDSEIGRIVDTPRSMIDERYRNKCITPSNVNEHLPSLLTLMNECSSVVECGVSEMTVSYTFAKSLIGRNGSITMIDKNRPEKMEGFLEMCSQENVTARFLECSDLECNPIETDMLFIDTWHVYGQLKRELAHWHTSVSKFIVVHNTTVDEWYGESVRGNADANAQSHLTGFPVEEIRKGLWPAITEFVRDHPEWSLAKRVANNNGMTVLSRMSQ